MPDREGEPLRRNWVRWILVRWRPLVVLALSLPLVGLAAATSFYWLGRAFPGFFLLENRLVPTVGRFEWTGSQAGLTFHSRVLAVNERAVTSAAEVYAAAESSGGGPLQYLVQKRGEAERTIGIETMRFGQADLWLTCGLFLLNGILVLAAGV